MYSPLQLALKYCNYYFTAANSKGHGMHSPFVFEFITKVLNDKTNYEAYTTVEALRKKLLHNETVLTIEDMGAGSATGETKQRKVSSIAKHAAKPKKFGQLLHRMVKYYQLQTILELGTSLGITTSYLSLAKNDAQIITMEGATEIAATANENFKRLHLQNIKLVEGNFDYTLSAVLYKQPKFDFVFIDGNHRQEPTEKYFQMLLPKLHNDSIIVFDDIHWSKEMEAAWKNIQDHPAVRCTIDLFFIGIVILRQEFKEKQHFTIRF